MEDEIEEKEIRPREEDLTPLPGKPSDDASRARMLTVGKLIAYLQTLDPNVCILGWEMNSEAYIEQLPELPNYLVRTVAESKKVDLEHLEHWYRGCENKQARIDRDLKTWYRYAKDTDLIIDIGR